MRMHNVPQVDLVADQDHGLGNITTAIEATDVSPIRWKLPASGKRL